MLTVSSWYLVYSVQLEHAEFIGKAYMSSFSDLTTDFANVNFVHNHQDLYALWQNRICPVYGFDVAPNTTDTPDLLW